MEFVLNDVIFFRDQNIAKMKASKAKTDRGRNPEILKKEISKLDVQEVKTSK